MNLPQNKYWNTWDDNSFAGIKFIPAGFSVVVAGEDSGGKTENEARDIVFFDINPLDILFEHEMNGRYTRTSVMQKNAVLSIEYVKADDFTVLGRIKALDVPQEYTLHLAMGFDGKDARLSAREKTESFGVREIEGIRGKYRVAVRLRNVPHEFQTNDAKLICSYNMIPGRTVDFTISIMEEEMTEGTELEADNRKFGEEQETIYMADGAAENAMHSFGEIFKYKNKKLEGRPYLDTEKYRGSLQRVYDLKGWADNYYSEAGIAYTSSIKLSDVPSVGWTSFFADLSFQIMTNAICSDRFMAKSTLDFMLRIISGEILIEGMTFSYDEVVMTSFPPVLSYCLLVSYYILEDREILEASFDIMMRGNSLCRLIPENITSLHCIDISALAFIAAILGKEEEANELNDKLEEAEKMYSEKQKRLKETSEDEDSEKTIWDYLWMRREGRDKEAREFADSAVGFVENDEFSRAILPGVIWTFEHFCIDPWNGISFGTTKAESFVLDNVHTPLGDTKIISDIFGTDIFVDERLIFRANFKGRFSNFVYSHEYRAVTLENREIDSGIINFLPLKPGGDGKGSSGVIINIGKGKYRVEVKKEQTDILINVIPL